MFGRKHVMPSRCLNCIYRTQGQMIQWLVPSIPMLLTHNRVTKDFGLGAIQGQPALFPHSDFWLERVIQSEGRAVGSEISIRRTP
jgi:hypothetical protein